MDGPTSSCKSSQIANTVPTTILTKTIANALITDINQGDTRNARERNVIYIKGLRIRMTFRNNNSLPKWVNVAVLNPKDPFPSSGGSANLFTTDKFFRILGQVDRSPNDGSTMNGLQWGTTPINTDTNNVVWHTRFRLGPRFETTTQAFTTGTGAPAYRTLSRYLKIGKKIAYQTTAGNTCLAPLWLVIYCSSFEEDATAPEAGNAIIYQADLVTYFTDAK